MIGTQTIRTKPWAKRGMAAALVSLPLFVVGCGGGGGRSSLNPVPTPTTTPTPTTSAERINLQFSQPTGNAMLPTTTSYAAAKDSGLLVQDGYRDESSMVVRFGEEGGVARNNIRIAITTRVVGPDGDIEVGDRYALSERDPDFGVTGDCTLTFSDGSYSYVTASGIFEVLGLTFHSNADPAKNTVTVRFKITNAVLKGGQGQNGGVPTRGLTLNATGETTLLYRGRVR